MATSLDQESPFPSLWARFTNFLRNPFGSGTLPTAVEKPAVQPPQPPAEVKSSPFLLQTGPTSSHALQPNLRRAAYALEERYNHPPSRDPKALQLAADVKAIFPLFVQNAAEGD